jgi:hypothetical protein
MYLDKVFDDDDNGDDSLLGWGIKIALHAVLINNFDCSTNCMKAESKHRDNEYVFR